MEARDLLLAFEDRTSLPVDVNDVVKYLRDHGNDDDIEFVGADLDSDILQGAVKIWHARNGVYAEPKRMVNIFYNRAEPKDWQRLICCKELLHLIDPTGAYSSNQQAIEKLADEIGLPPEMQDPFKAGFGTNVDRVAELRAAALLLPWAAREIMLPYFEDGKLSITDIARQADIPRKYAGIVMHPAWEGIYGSMMRKVD